MFFGAVPTDCIEQVFKIMEIDKWEDCYVACSGSFRLERALSQRYPDLRIHSNDVSVYSAVMGGLATGEPIDFEFTDRLEFVNDLIEGRCDVTRGSAVMVACEMSRYARSNNRYNKKHFKFYCDNFADFMEKTKGRMDTVLADLHVASYFSGDWRLHAKKGADEGAGILAFPPFFMGDYESQFKFIEGNIKWEGPDYDIYDPSMLRSIARDFEERGDKYCFLTDQVWEDAEPVIRYVAGRKVPHFCYANTGKSSFRHKTSRSEPFRYTPVDPKKLTRKSKLEIGKLNSAQLNFIKDVYLAHTIVHSSGLGNYGVFLDGKLVGAIIYDDSPTTAAAYGPGAIYILSDVTVTTEGKMSKLVAMLAKSRSLLRPLELQMLKRYTNVVTTARTKKHAPMKYRGPFKKLSKKRDVEADNWVIQYGADVVEDTPQEIYLQWWDKHGKNNVK